MAVESASADLKQVLYEKELLSSALNVLEDGIHVVDSQGRTFFYSKALEKIERYRSNSVLGKHISEAYHLDDETSILLKVLKQGKPIKNHHAVYMTKEKEKVNIITNTYPIRSGKKVIGAVSVNSNITAKKRLVETISQLQKQIKQTKHNRTQYEFDDIIGTSSTMQNTKELAKRAATSMSPVLIQGETGTGKELFAQSIHNYSLRSKGPFVAVNCAAIPATLLESALFGTEKGAFTGAEDKTGLFEEAHQGTLFLDEISSMDLALQAKLLRVVETKKIRRLGGNKEISVNPRIISALNIDPQKAIASGRIRHDLFYRLAVVNLIIPPLRERGTDIPLLAKHFIDSTNRIINKSAADFTKEVYDLFYDYHWPGNVRELEHAVEHAVNVVDESEPLIKTAHLPPHLKHKYIPSEGGGEGEGGPKPFTGNNLESYLLGVERSIILQTLRENRGNISKAARTLGYSRQRLQHRIKRLNIEL
ncbi:MAG TPA: sigma 54-interacting transcriptional regulator [Firmicutes bacterium]|nr:sigma 54-interacting transcriptional regulator [Bacillota bacterium]